MYDATFNVAQVMNDATFNAILDNHGVHPNARALLEGPDACLVSSLAEHGVIWFPLNDAQGTIRFIYRTFKERDRDEIHTDWSDMTDDTNLFIKYDWVNWEWFLAYAGYSSIEWLDNNPFADRVFAMAAFLGFEEVFGESYYPTKTKVTNETEEE
jgi:hypothetical protein